MLEAIPEQRMREEAGLDSAGRKEGALPCVSASRPTPGRRGEDAAAVRLERLPPKAWSSGATHVI
jgi:hypothetical protein